MKGGYFEEYNKSTTTENMVTPPNEDNILMQDTQQMYEPDSIVSPSPSGNIAQGIQTNVNTDPMYNTQ